MTYKEYILRRKLPDCVDSYRNFLEENNSIYSSMPEKMKLQTVSATYLYRFCPSAGGNV